MSAHDVLQRFAAPATHQSKWLTTLFALDGSVGATDGRRAAFIEEEASSFAAPDERNVPALRDFARPFTPAFTITPAEFIAWAGEPEAPLEPCAKCASTGWIECKACDGEGLDTCPTCDHEMDCPGCVGDGGLACACPHGKRQEPTTEPGRVGGVLLDRRLARDAGALFAEVAPGAPIGVETSGPTSPVRFRAGRAVFVLAPLSATNGVSVPELQAAVTP